MESRISSALLHIALVYEHENKITNQGWRASNIKIISQASSTLRMPHEEGLSTCKAGKHGLEWEMRNEVQDNLLRQ